MIKTPFLATAKRRGKIFVKRAKRKISSLNRKHVTSRSRYAVGISTATFALALSFQNCTGKSDLNSASTNSPSPFKSPQNSREGIVLSGDLVSAMSSGDASIKKLTGTEVIPKATKLAFIVDDGCIKDRISGPLDRYFLDKYLDKNMELTPDKKFNQSLVLVTLVTDLTFDNLVKIKRSDSCISGIANDQGIQYKLSQAADIRGQQTYLNQMQFDKSFYDSNTDSGSVTVAVIDSGYDFVAAPPINLVDTAFMLGTNYVEGNNNPQDTLGHGTAVTSLIAAKPTDGKSFTGVASNVSKILPIRTIDKDGKSTIGGLFRAMKHAVNGGAEVINISLGAIAGEEPEKRKPGMDISCDPIFGQSIFEAVDNGVFLVMSAGNMTHCETVNGQEVCYPGEINSPKDNSTEKLFDYNFVPACWARYYKGVIAVSSVDSSGKIGAHSNWGEDAVEMAAPGEGVLAAGLNGSFNSGNGTSFAAPLVTGAIANTIGYFKKRGWFYNPWIIEDTLINGTPTSPQLWGSSIDKKVRLGKSLNFKVLQDYLVSLNSKTEQERRQQPSDNPEQGQGLNRSLASEARRPIKLEVYTKEEFINVKNQGQVQAVVYYSDATTLVVSDQVVWSTPDKSKLQISSTGMAYPMVTGQIPVSATYNGLTGSSQIRVVDFNTWTGSNGTMTQLKLVQPSYKYYGIMYPAVYASYSDGRQRLVKDYTMIVSRTTKDGRVISSYYQPKNEDDEPFYVGGAEYTISVLYRGMRVDSKQTLPKYELKFAQVFKSKYMDYSVVPAGFLKEATLTRNSNNNVGCYFDYAFAGEPEGNADMPMYLVNNDARYDGYKHVAVKRGFVPSAGIVESYAFAADYLSSVYTPDDTAAKTATYSCELIHWGSGLKQKFTYTKEYQVVEAQPVKIKFGAAPLFDYKAFLTDPYYSAGTTIVVEYDNGSTRDIAGTAQLNIYSADGSENKLNYTQSGSYYARFFIYKAQKGEVLKLRAKDALTGLSADMNITVNGTVTPPPAALPPVTLAAKTLLPEKADSAYCAAHANDKPFAGGTGTPTDPNIICTPAQLVAINKLVFTRVENSYSYTQNGSFRLGANIDMSGISMNDLPIRIGGTFGDKKPHIFDGDGYRISGASLADAENNEGLFYVIWSPLWAAYTTDYQFKNMNITNVQIRGKVAALFDHELQCSSGCLSLDNVRAHNIYLEGNSAIGFGEGVSLNNVGITGLSLKTNPIAYASQTVTVLTSSYLGSNVKTNDVYAEFEVLGAPRTTIYGITGKECKSCYLKAKVRSGVQSSFTGFGSGTKNCKLEAEVNMPGGTFVAYGVPSDGAVYKQADYTGTITAGYGVQDSEFTGDILLGSEFEGGTYFTLGNVLLGRVSGFKGKATVNARRLSAVAGYATFPTVINSNFDITAVNVPAGAEVAKYIHTRQGVKGEAIFTNFKNNVVQLNGVNAPDIFKDVNNQSTQTMQLQLAPAGWEQE